MKATFPDILATMKPHQIGRSFHQRITFQPTLRILTVISALLSVSNWVNARPAAKDDQSLQIEAQTTTKRPGVTNSAKPAKRYYTGSHIPKAAAKPNGEAEGSGALHVITREKIDRTGARTVVDALRRAEPSIR